MHLKRPSSSCSLDLLQAEAALAAEKKALKAWYDKQLEEAMARARQEYDEKLEARAEELRMTLVSSGR